MTDCTRVLNEWVYSGDHTRLMSTQPRQLPELVRRFTQDIYMCVYIQPDVALYGKGEGEDDGDLSPGGYSSKASKISKPLISLSHHFEYWHFLCLLPHSCIRPYVVHAHLVGGVTFKLPV